MSRECLDDSPVEDGAVTPQEEDDDIDQFNEDTFGSGAVEDWEQEPACLPGSPHPRGDSRLPQRGLADSISRLVVHSQLREPTGARGVHCESLQQVPQLNPSMWEGPLMFPGMGNAFLSHLEDSRSLSGSRDPVLPRRPPLTSDEERDLSDRAPPPRSSSPVIGSPPVRTAPIGTPPKQPTALSLGQQPSILCPTPRHVRAPQHQRFPPCLGDGRPPSQILSAMASRISPTQLSRVHGLLGGQLTSVPGTLLPSRMGPLVPPVVGFRPYYSPPGAGHIHTLRSAPPVVRGDTTHLHPQHRRLLIQRFHAQSSRSQPRGQNGVCEDRRGGYSELPDPYCNLMTQREKDWVCKVQMMQLQSANPSLDDYYYQNYFERLEQKQSVTEQSSEIRRKERTRLITPQLARLEHTYRPVQFEGSLGKLTVSSVNNPRKMIDAVVTTRGEDDETRDKQVRDKRRQTLYTIERTYSLLLEVKDIEKRFLHLPETERLALLEVRRAKIAQIYDSLRGKQSDRPSDEHFVQILCIGKGKRLASRVLGLLETQEASTLLLVTARNLPLLARKDSQEEVLPSLTEPCRHLVGRLSSGALTELLQQLTEGPGNHFHSVLQNKFGLTLFYTILSQGERLQASHPPSELMQDNRWTELVFGVTRELLSVPRTALATPVFVPENLLDLFSHYVDRQRLTVLEAKLQLSTAPQ